MMTDRVTPVPSSPSTSLLDEKLERVFTMLERIEQEVDAVKAVQAAAYRAEEADDQTRSDIAKALEALAHGIRENRDIGLKCMSSVAVNTEAIRDVARSVLEIDGRLDVIQNLAERAARASDHVNLR
jgi:acyl-CoA reductase-like NAD-dependent aldehyde dehydrogenase